MGIGVVPSPWDGWPNDFLIRCRSDYYPLPVSRADSAISGFLNDSKLRLTLKVTYCAFKIKGLNQIVYLDADHPRSKLTPFYYYSPLAKININLINYIR